MSTRLISHTQTKYSIIRQSHSSLQKLLPLWGTAIKNHRGEKVVTVTTVKVNVTLGHRSGLLQSVGSRFKRKGKKKNKKGAVPTEKLTDPLCWSAEEKHLTEDARSVWKCTSNSRHTVLSAALGAW